VHGRGLFSYFLAFALQVRSVIIEIVKLLRFFLALRTG
jgi:hypothetical protein